MSNCQKDMLTFLPSQVVPGDELISVDDAPVESLSYVEISRKVRGSAGTCVRMKFRRPALTTTRGNDSLVENSGDFRVLELRRGTVRPVLQCAAAFGKQKKGNRGRDGRRQTFMIL